MKRAGDDGDLPTQERPAIQNRVLPRLLSLLLLLAAAGAAAYVAWRPDGTDDPDSGTSVARETERDAEAPPPVELKGRAGAQAVPDPQAPRPLADGTAHPAALRAAIEAISARAITSMDGDQKQDPLGAPRFPERPGRPDQALGDPYRAPRYRRVDLLGRHVAGTGPWLPDGRGLVFTGVAHVDHEDAGEAVEEEIEEPLVTAIVGKIMSSGEPVAGAEVILYSTFYQRHVRYDHHVREVGRAITDGYGVFDLRPVGLDTVHFGSNGEVLLTVHKAGFGSIVARRLENIEPEVENDLGTFAMSTQAATLVGIVRNLQGEPVEGAAVRVSGSVNPVLYDKTERMIILKDCPTAVTDEEGNYRVPSFAVGDQHVSIHVNIDCTQHFQAKYAAGEQRYDTQVQAGNSIKGRIVNAAGHPVAAAVVSCTDNWTPSNPDGTFWLDNIVSGPVTLQIAHHLYACEFVQDVAFETEDLEVVMTSPLPRIELVVRTAESDTAIPLITIVWHWENGHPPHRFVTTSRNWHAADGRYDVVVPEGAIGAHVGAQGRTAMVLAREGLEDGRVTELALPLNDNE